MYKYGEKVKVVKIGDENYGMEGEVINARARLEGDIVEYVVKFGSGQYGRYFSGEVDLIGADIRNAMERPAAFNSTAADRKSAFERALYAEKTKTNWKNYINSTDSAGVPEEIENAYKDLFDAIDLVAVLEKRASYGR